METTLPRPDPSTFVPPAEPTSASTRRRLARPRDGRRLGGVCAAIADRYGRSRTTIRVLAVLSILLPGPQVIAYLVAWVLIPDETDLRPIVEFDVHKAADDLTGVVRR